MVRKVLEMSLSSAVDFHEPARPALHQRGFFRAALALLIYVDSYVILSANGAYHWRASGEHRWGHGLAVLDQTLWCPFGIRWDHRRSIDGKYIIDADIFGWFFLPAIAVDRQWIHPTKRIFVGPNG